MDETLERNIMTKSEITDRIAASGAFVETFVVEPKHPGILDGLSFAVKDLIDVEGRKTGCGNPTWRDTHPAAAANAVCVDQLLFSGATCLGKTITDELAFGLNGENHFYGTPLNPRAPDRIPGGSSCGSASAVASGIVDFALGTDTGGSVRAPASYCGIFGMRPSHGIVSVAGVNPLAPTFDTVGFFASDLSVLSRVGSVLLACDIPHAAEWGTINFLTDAFAIADAEVREALEGPVALIKERYPRATKEISLTDFGAGSSQMRLDDWYSAYCHVQWPEIWSCLGSWVTEANPEFGPRTKKSFELVKNFSRENLVEATRTREAYYGLLKDLLGDTNLICMPTTPTLPPLKGTLGVDRTAGDYYPRALALTAIAGIGRLPQVTLPVGDAGGVPVGLSLIGPERKDAFLLAAAQFLPNTCGWSGACNL
jgi:amidase